MSRRRPVVIPISRGEEPNRSVSNEEAVVAGGREEGTTTEVNPVTTPAQQQQDERPETLVGPVSLPFSAAMSTNLSQPQQQQQQRGVGAVAGNAAAAAARLSCRDEAAAIVRQRQHQQQVSVQMLVEERLKNSWGRPLYPVGVDLPVLHQQIASKRNHPCQDHVDYDLEGDAMDEDADNDDDEISWKDIEERCATHPLEAAVLDRRGRTCLHAACCCPSVPVSTVAALVDACGRGGSSILDRDKHGRTPLLLAITAVMTAPATSTTASITGTRTRASSATSRGCKRAHASLRVIAWLLQKCPKAATVNDHLGHLPLHLACDEHGTTSTASTQQVRQNHGDHSKRAVVELVRLLLAAYPEAAARESFNGRTPLHLAMEARAPVAVVQQLVAAYPAAVMADGCGLNPLFVAIRFNADAAVVKTLVDACPAALLSRDRGNGLPLRRAMENQSPLAVQLLLCTLPEIVLDVDHILHQTALHAALECGSAREGTVELLVQTAPEICHVKSKSGHTPLTLALHKWQLVAHRSPPPPRPRVPTATSAATQSLWNICVLLMKGAYYGRCTTNAEASAAAAVVRTTTAVPENADEEANGSDPLLLPLLHAAVALPQVPYAVVTEALRLNSLEVSVMDSCGKYPLHMALEHKPPLDYAPGALVRSTVEDYLQQKEDVILQLLSLYPDAAWQTNEKQERLALCMAANSCWISLVVLERLLTIYPLALRRVDALYALYPFQIAALPKNHEQDLLQLPRTVASRWDSAQELLQISSIYELLRQGPDLLGMTRK